MTQVNPQLLKALTDALGSNGNDNGTRQNRKYVDVPAKEGATSRAETLSFSWTTNEGGRKVWATDHVVRRISRGTEQEDGSVRGGGNATYSAQTNGGGFDLPYGFDTEFKVGGILVPRGVVTTDEIDKTVQRLNCRCEIALPTDGQVAAVVLDAAGHRIFPETDDDLYNVRVLVTKGKKPYFVKMTAQHKSSVGFNGLSGDVQYEDYEA